MIENEILLAGKILSTNNLSRIAGELGYRPILIMNAVYSGEKAGKFVYNKKKDIITISKDTEIDHLALTDTINELREVLEVFIANINSEEKDMSLEELQLMLGGTPDLHIKMAVASSDKLLSYEMADPSDKKSVYTFFTLSENIDKQWAAKQFVKKDKKGKKDAGK